MKRMGDMMKRVLIGLGLVVGLGVSPAVAESWQGVTTLSDGAMVSIDRDSVRRGLKKYDQVSFKVGVTGHGATAVARMRGNCTTGSWNVTSGKKNALTVTIGQETGDQLLQWACGMPAQVNTR